LGNRKIKSVQGWLHSQFMRVILYILIFIPLFCQAQIELGGVTGFNKIGINPKNIQPIYGTTVQFQASKIINLEACWWYSQREVDNGHRDYLDFLLQPKIGYFGKVAGLYFGYGLVWNPALYHENKENHSYGSFLPSIGGQIKLPIQIIFQKLPITYLELKASYDNALSPGLLKDGQWYDYNGLLINTIIKIRLHGN